MAAYTAVNDAGLFMNTVLYTGTGSSLGVTGVGFQPDMVWLKVRNTTGHHQVFDAARGVTKVIYPSQNDAEATIAESLKTFGSDGFTLGTGSYVNTNTNTYVSWNWKAGTTTGIAGSPSITPSSYSFNQTSGNSIIAYTGNGVSGATIPHGLGAVPDMVLVKSRTTADPWLVFTSARGATKYLVLNTSAAEATASWAWNDTAPTSTLVSLGNAGEVNGNTEDYVAYCFTNVKGYSHFGSYLSNGSTTNGPFIYTGFRPAWTLIKMANGSNPWVLDDVKREPINEMEKPLKPDNTDGTYSGSAYGINFLSNGFQIRNNDSTYNGSAANTFVYAAFAESPFVNSSGVPTNAR
jgi:hypothetical protein